MPVCGQAAELPDNTQFDSMYYAIASEEPQDIVPVFTGETGDAEAAFPEALAADYVGDYIGSVSGLGTDYGRYVGTQILLQCAAYQVDPVLALSLFQQESGFRMDAISPAGAVGIAQLMPATAAGLSGNPYVLEDNIRCGVEYLSRQLGRFATCGEYQATFAIAAYNAGPASIAEYGDVPPYFETRQHVNAVAANYENIQRAIPVFRGENVY